MVDSLVTSVLLPDVTIPPEKKRVRNGYDVPDNRFCSGIQYRVRAGHLVRFAGSGWMLCNTFALGPDAATMLCYGLVFMGFIKRPHSFHYGAVGFGHVVIVMCGRKPAGSQKGGSGRHAFPPVA